MNAYDIIIRPIITEKTMNATQEKKYTFEVADVNKIEIAKAVEKVFPGVKVAKVNTVNVRGRMRRQGATYGYTPSWKKAVVTLTPDSKSIEIFDGLI